MTVKESGGNSKTRSFSPELQKAMDYFKEKETFLPPPLTRAAYSDRMAWILASMAHLAYDRYEDNRMARKLFIAKLQGGGFKLIKTFYSKETDTQAFLAESEDGYAVLAFRGTEISKREDMKIDIEATKISVLDGRVHSGFRIAYESVAKDIEANILKLKGIPLYITGHSLGPRWLRLPHNGLSIIPASGRLSRLVIHLEARGLEIITTISNSNPRSIAW
jgi:hypothetical protein